MRDITLITGCMFSGKTTRLIEFHNYSEFMPEEKIMVKPLLDTRYRAGHVQAHSGLSLPGHRISKPEELYPLIDPSHKELFLDEIQFFNESLGAVLLDLSLAGLKVYCAGLDTNYLGQPYAVIGGIKKHSTNHILLKARCAVCSEPATHTYRTGDSTEEVLIGHTDLYEARCEKHWQEGMAGKVI